MLALSVRVTFAQVPIVNANPDLLSGVSNATVLVVEDDPALRALYWSALTAAGYAVAAFEDGFDALRHVELSGVPDAVVLDLDLPRVSGRDVHHELAAQYPTTKSRVVVVTGSEDIADLDPKHFACILRKPILVEALVHAIENCLKATDVR